MFCTSWSTFVDIILLEFYKPVRGRETSYDPTLNIRTVACRENKRFAQYHMASIGLDVC